MGDPTRTVLFRDSTLREGLDTPQVAFSSEQRLRIARFLDEARVSEIELVAPSRVLEDLRVARTLKDEGLKVQLSGLIYATGARYDDEIKQASECLDWITLLMPASVKRKPYGREEKRSILADALDRALQHKGEIGVGFPHSTQTELEFLVDMGGDAVRRGARRVTIYDTNGSGDPFGIHELVGKLARSWDVELFFHGHNDLGLATANSVAAVLAGASGVDATVNGLGDRAGNASLEQVVMNLRLRGFTSPVRLEMLTALSRAVEEMSGVTVSKLAPIVGEYVFSHKSPSHLEVPELFEAFCPQSVGGTRQIVGRD